MPNGDLQQFDVTPITGLSSSQKFQGNLVSDITSALATYQSGTPVGRGGEYATSAQSKYGYASIRDAAAGYLQAAGLRFLPFTSQAPTPVEQQPTPAPVTPVKQPFEVLADTFSKFFGTTQDLQPLRSQAIDYTPVQTSAPSPVTSAGGFNFGSIFILAILGIAGYFVYKKVKGT